LKLALVRGSLTTSKTTFSKFTSSKIPKDDKKISGKPLCQKYLHCMAFWHDAYGFTYGCQGLLVGGSGSVKGWENRLTEGDFRSNREWKNKLKGG
jgi:hypothetical protein